MDDRPLVSVIIPTYNRPELLDRAVRSVLDQTYDNLEIIVVDDGSDALVDDRSDSHLATAVDGGSEASGALLEVISHEGNRGANVARNTGISASNGRFVAFLDDDDRWRPEKVERQLEALRSADDDVAVAFTGQVVVDPSGEVTNVVEPATEGDFATKLVEAAPFGTFSTVMVRSDAFELAGYPDERFPCWQDRDWYFSLAEHFDFVSVPEPLTVRQLTGGPQLSDRYESMRDVAFHLMIDKHRPQAASLGPAYERRFLASLLHSVGMAAISAGHYADARRFLVRSLWYCPTEFKTYAYLLVALGGPYAVSLAQLGKRAVNRLVYRL